MIGLFLDTSSKYLTICLLKDEKVVDMFYQKYDNDMSKYVVLELENLFKKNNIKPSDIKEIYCVNGPGSFTGIRVGVTIAKTFAWSINIDVIPVSSLFLMATSIKNYDYIIPIIDARRDCVYGAIYDKNYHIILEEKYIKLDELKKEILKLNGSYIFVSNDIIKEIKIKEYVPDINNLIKNIDKKYVNHHQFAPNYLKKVEV